MPPFAEFLMLSQIHVDRRKLCGLPDLLESNSYASVVGSILEFSVSTTLVSNIRAVLINWLRVEDRKSYLVSVCLPAKPESINVFISLYWNMDKTLLCGFQEKFLKKNFNRIKTGLRSLDVNDIISFFELVNIRRWNIDWWCSIQNR